MAQTAVLTRISLSAKVFHIPFIPTTSQLKLSAIVQRTPKAGDSAPEAHPNLKHYTDIKALLADPAIAVVVLTTPPNTHFDYAKAALEAGKHVLVEKPFVPTSAEASKLAEIARANKRLLCVFQNRRWDTDFLTVRYLLEQGTLGELVEFNSHFDRLVRFDADTWKAQLPLPQGGSALLDLGTHLVDQAYHLFGMPTSVRGRVFRGKAGNADFMHPDSFSAELLYADGKVVNVRSCGASVETSQRRFWIRGTKGSFHKMGVDLQEPQLLAGGKPTDKGFGKDPASCMSMSVLDGNGQPKAVAAPDLEPETYIKFYRSFGDAIASGNEEDIPVKANEAFDVLRILEAVRESAETGNAVSL